MPCVQRKKRAEREDFIRKNRREVDPYAGVTDPVEIIRIHHTLPPYDPFVVMLPPPRSMADLYASLTSCDVTRLIHLTLDDIAARGAIDTPAVPRDNFPESVARSLISFTDHSIDPLLSRFVELNHLWPPQIFRNASPEIRDAILEKLSSDLLDRNHALKALAWIGGPEIEDLFRQWDAIPPSWSSSLFITPSGYSHVAGWELTEEGRRDLYHHQCWAITPAADGKASL
jgi:hypothetical protein